MDRRALCPACVSRRICRARPARRLAGPIRPAISFAPALHSRHRQQARRHHLFYGFNVWSFFAADPFGSSHTALSVFGLNLIPYDAGISIFLIIVLALTGAAVFFYAGEIRRGGREFNASRLCFWLLHLALINLGFNLFLAGTHERYLYHFYPFVIAAFLALPFTSGRSMTATLAGAIFYGGFLFGYLTGWNEYFGRLIFNGMGVFHAIFFVHLAWIFARYAKTLRAAGAPA